MIAIRVTITEPGGESIEHVFRSYTQRGAEELLKAHTQTDAFLRSALRHSRWKTIPLKVTVNVV